MKTKLVTSFLICFLSFCLPISVTACPPPSCPDCYTGSACDVYLCGCWPSPIGFTVWPSTKNRYVCIDDTVTFSAWPYTWDGDGCPLIYSWDFGRDYYDPCTGAGNWVHCRYSSPGDRTVTLTVTRVTIPNSCCSTPRTDRYSRTVTVVKVESLQPDPGPGIEEIDDGDGDADTRSFAVCVADAGVVTVRATPNPVVAEDNLPGYGYTWGWQLTGGTGSSWLIRTVSRTTPGVTTITCVCGSSFKKTKIYVYEATLKLYSDEGEGLWPPLNGNTWGHSWWYLGISSFCIELIWPTELRDYVNTCGGWWPKTSWPINPFEEYEGEVRLGEQGHTPTGEGEWQITFEGLHAALTHVNLLKIGWYQPFVVWSHNCTDEAVTVGETAGVPTINASSNPTTPKQLSDWLNSP